MDRIFREYIDADDLQNAAHALPDPQGLIENGDHEIRADCDPYLRLHGVFAQPEERLHAKVLLDPFEEELDLPASLVNFRDYQGIDLEVVGDEDQELSRFRVPEAYPPQVVREELPCLRPVEADGLVGSQAGGLVHCAGIADVVAHVGLGPGDKEGPGRMDGGQTKEIFVSTIQYVEGSGLENDPIQGVDVVDLSLGDRDEHGDGAAQVDHRVELYRGLSPAKASPWKEIHAQVYRGGVDGVDDLVHIQYVSICSIQIAGLSDENLGELEVDPPASMFVGVGEVRARHRPADPHSVKQAGLGSKAGLDVAKALPEGKLGESHAKELVPRGEAFARPRHGIFGYATLKLLSFEGIADLSENKTANVHASQSQQGPIRMESDSNA